MNRYFIYLSYNGKNYCGWQFQPNGVAIQHKLEEAISILQQKPASVVGAGRTDAGVHAKLMVAHFDWNNEINCAVLTEKLNRMLPPDIAIHKIIEVTANAHARFDAISRTYNYCISATKNPFLNDFSYRITFPLDFDRMNQAAYTLFDYTDFTSFSKLHTDVKTNNCKIIAAHWKQEGESWVFTIQADRFLRNMVRAIVGTLIEVGRGRLTIDGFRRVIEQKDRGKAGTSVPGHALFLVNIEYPETIFQTRSK